MFSKDTDYLLPGSKRGFRETVMDLTGTVQGLLMMSNLYVAAENSN